MAVALEDGLITPVIKDVANKTLSGISIVAKELASRAREGKLEPHEYQGGTFTVSKHGHVRRGELYGDCQPAVGCDRGGEQPHPAPRVRRRDNVVPQNTMKLTIGSDHRVVNGAETRSTWRSSSGCCRGQPC